MSIVLACVALIIMFMLGDSLGWILIFLIYAIPFVAGIGLMVFGFTEKKISMEIIGMGFILCALPVAGFMKVAK